MIRDHLDAEYPSKKAMCRAWGVSENTFRGRMERGLSLEQCLTGRWEGKAGGYRTDHEWREHASAKAMCASWGVPLDVFRDRIRRGWDLARALTEPVRDLGQDGARSGPATDHTGAVFPSEAAMCRHWGIGQPTFHNRIRKGWTLEAALTYRPGPSAKANSIPATDHEGTEWPSMLSMCRHWNANAGTVQARLGRGEDIKQALTRPRRNGTRDPERSGRSVQGPFGEAYGNYAALCKALGLPPDIYGHAYTVGTPEKAAAACARYWTGKSAGMYHNLEAVEFPWFRAGVDGRDAIMHFKAIIKEYRTVTERE